MFDFAVELFAGHGRPTAFGPNSVAHLFVVRPEFVACFSVRFCQVTMRVYSDLSRRSAELRECAMIKVGIGAKAVGIAANDGEHQRQVIMRRANNGFGTTPDANPGLESAAFNFWKYALVGKRRARLSAPRDRFVLQ